MYEQIVISENKNYGNDASIPKSTKSIIVKNASVEHIAITAIDTKAGTSIEVMIRKDQLPEWLNSKE